jgi:CRP-like cAMP-binding protein
LSTEALAQIPIFSGLTVEECRQVQHAGHIVIFSPEETIVEQNGMSQDLWILLEGKCDVVRSPLNGKKPPKPIVLATLEPYSNFGEMSFFHAAPHSAHVRAQTEVTLLRLERSAFDRLAVRHPGVASKLAINTVASLADRVRRMDDWVADLVTQKAVAEKVPELARLREQLFDGWKL